MLVVLLFFKQYSIVIFFFFFSSRRRHTRSTRDWSSDVCSSDLLRRGARSMPVDQYRSCPACRGGRAARHSTRLRSEERRVGKECRSRWWRHHQKKKSGKTHLADVPRQSRWQTHYLLRVPRRH